MQKVKPSITDIYLIWVSGPGHLSPARICCPGMVLLGNPQHGKSKTGQVFIPRSRGRSESACQTGTWRGKCQGSILCDLCLMWIQSPRLPPFHNLMCFPRPKISSPSPLLFFLIQLHQVARIRAYRMGKHCHDLSASHSQGTNTRRKKISSWRTRTETFLFWHGL